jgi:VWFA-related protein
MLLDVSESMQEELSTVKEASCGFIDQLGSEDRVSLYAFNHSLIPGVRLTSDFEEPKDAIRRLSAAGGTALYDAVVRVLNDLGPVKGRKAIVVFSDGRDERSLSSLERTIEMARRSEVLIYAVAAGETEQDLAARQDLEVLAEETGGEVHLIQKFKHLPRVFSSILDDLRAQYSLSYEPPEGPAGERQVRVEVQEGKKYRVRCRRSYYYTGE